MMKPSKKSKSEPTPVLLSMAEAARRLNVCTRTVRRSIARGRIHATKLRIGEGEGLWRIPETEVDRVIAEGQRHWR